MQQALVLQVVVTLLAVPRLSVELLTLVDHPLQVEALTSEARLTQAEARLLVGHLRVAAVQLLVGHRPQVEAPLVAVRLWGLRSRRCPPAWESCLSLP